MVGPVALDQILRLLFRGADRAALERDGRDDLLSDRFADAAGFRVPPHMISNFEVLLHRHDLFDCLVVCGFRFRIESW